MISAPAPGVAAGNSEGRFRPVLLLLVTVILAWAQAHQVSAADLNSRSVLVSAGAETEIPLAGLKEGSFYGVTVWFPDLIGLDEADAVNVSILDASGEAVSKLVHGGDPDLYVTLRPRKDGDGKILLSAQESLQGKIYQLRAACVPMNIGFDSNVLVGALPSSDWRNAQPIELGKTVFASNDERPYIPKLGTPEQTFTDLMKGGQWYTFTWAGPQSALVHFMIDILDRDVPVDVMLFRREGEKLTPHWKGVERHIPEQSTPFHGLYKFIAREVPPGTYYVRAMGNHPAYQLRTDVYELPPYKDPQKAVRAGMDFLLKKGDSWHANTPRRGGVIMRNTNMMAETRQCIACHPTHFTTRGGLVAIENGYPVKARASFQFLTERLYNNPRPIYGDADAVWARMISAPGSVFGRLGYMLNGFEKAVSHEQRDDFLDPVGNYLAKFWNGVEKPYTDSNGNLPRVSGFQVALHGALVFEELYARTQDDKWKALYDQLIEGVSKTETADMIDLSWKIVALSTFDKEKFAAPIAKMVDQMFSHQREDGTWTMVFDSEVIHHHYHDGTDTLVQAPKGEDGKPIYSEFQTFHCMYAAAKAGVTADDPRLAKSIDWCLSRQWTNGAWQGNADYKNFDTPFRDTQFAIMALSELFKGPGGDGWMAGFDPAPKDFDLNDVGATLSALDQYWQGEPAEVQAKVREAFNHEQPMVRFAAASAAGRLADASSVEGLATLLGDPSKMVQRGAAWALRQIASRKTVGHDKILAALDSADDRTRWGAVRIFNQHFKYLTEDASLAKGLIARMQKDPVPVIRMTASQGLWQWWAWEKSNEGKGEIEDAFVAELAKAEHPWVRRNLIEAFYNTQDENQAYFYNSWTRQVYDDAQRKVLTDGHRAFVKLQAERIRETLINGNDLQRDGILRSYYTFHLREIGGDPARVSNVPLPEYYLHPEPVDRGQNAWIGGYMHYADFTPLLQGDARLSGIGNDHDTPVYYEDSGPIVAEGFLAVLNDGPPVLQPRVLRALKRATGVPTNDAFSTRMIQLAVNPEPSVQGELRPLVLELLPGSIENGESTQAALADAITSGGDFNLQLVEAILSNRRNGDLAASEKVASALEKRFMESAIAGPDMEKILGAVTYAAPLHAKPEFAKRFADVIIDSATPIQQKAIRSGLMSPTLIANPEARERIDAVVASADPARMQTLLAAVSTVDYEKVKDDAGLGFALGLLTNGLRHEDESIRVKAVEGIRGAPKLQNNPAVLALIQDLARQTTGTVQQAAASLQASFDSKVTLANQDITQLLDYGFFVKEIQPLLEREATSDGMACVKCHANHSIFRLNKPEPGGALTEDQLRQNYLAALKVIDPASPEASLLILKPTKPFEGIELPGSYRKTHGGSVRWPETKSSEEYRTMLRWIQGARLESSDTVQVVLAPSPQPAAAGETSAPFPVSAVEPPAASPAAEVVETAKPAEAAAVTGSETVVECPVMAGEPVNFALVSRTDDGPVFFCCEACKKRFDKDPAGYADLVALQREQLAKLDKVQVVCPVSNEPVDPAVTMDHDGQKVAFCCGGCLEAFRKEPAKYAVALANAFTYQTKCPVSGGAISPAAFVALEDDARVYFCCDKCAAKFKESPEQFAAALEQQGYTYKLAPPKPAPDAAGVTAEAPPAEPAPAEPVEIAAAAQPAQAEPVEAAVIEDLGPPTCPVNAGAPIDFTISLATDAGPVFFCCPKCCKAFAENPDKFTDQAALQRKQLAALDKIQVVCPVSGAPVDKSVTLEYEGKLVSFCCGDCCKKFAEAPADYTKGLANSYSYQTECPVSGKVIHPAAFVSLNTGAKVYFCCLGCKEEFAAHPGNYLASLKEMGLGVTLESLAAAAPVEAITPAAETAQAPPAESEPEPVAEAAPEASVAVTCPVAAGSAVDFSISLATDSGPVFFCCPNCCKAYSEDPAKFSDQAAAQRSLLSTRAHVQVICPVSKQPIDKSVMCEHEGQMVAFCCKGCREKFVADPKSFAAGLANSYTWQTVCPVSGSPISSKSFVAIGNGASLYFCCDGCKGAFEKEPGKYVDKVKALGINLQVENIKVAQGE